MNPPTDFNDPNDADALHALSLGETHPGDALHDGDSLTLSQLSPHHNLQEALSRLEAQVRQEPGQAKHRWALVEMLCIMGMWERALKQLQVSVQLNPAWHAKAQWVRSLIRAEHQRVEVFAGQLLPTPVVDRPQWMEDMARAISHNARGEHAQADALRAAALEAAPTQAGHCKWRAPSEAGPTASDEATQEQAFEWISDSDTRLGPVCELIIAGSYRWVAYSDIAHLHIQPPQSLLNLVWLPVRLSLRATQSGTQTLHGCIPSRYVDTPDISADVGSAQRDALMLARLSQWRNVGETGVFALGQKTLMSAGMDWPLFDVRELRSA